MNTKRVLVHACCAPCSSYSFEKLINDGYEIEGYFYNPNIHPEEEYNIRKNEFINYCETKNFNYSIKEDNVEVWHKTIKGLENEPEGSTRCHKCFNLRLEETAKAALKCNFDAFSTVLTISPHKNTTVINKIGKELSDKYDIEFIEENFKKQDGFKKSLEISKTYNLYRQQYCGCIYSIRNKN